MEDIITNWNKLELIRKAAISLDNPSVEEDYILHLACNHCGGEMKIAASSSNYSIRLFNKQTLASDVVLKGHQAPLVGLAFSPDQDHLLYSASQDYCIWLWDLRSCKRPSLIFSSMQPPKALLSSLSVNCSGQKICAGTDLDYNRESQLLIWDVRRANEYLTAFSDSHSDEISQTSFHPSSPSSLLSGSRDGLVCLFDTDIQSEDEALQTSFNASSSISRLGWCGDGAGLAYALTDFETLHVWKTSGEYETISEILSGKTTDDEDVPFQNKKYPGVELLVDCFSVKGEALPLCITSDREGLIQVMKVEKDSLGKVGEMKGGHSAAVRCAIFDSQNETAVTGGEDSMLCLWSTEKSNHNADERKITLKLKAKSGLSKESNRAKVY